MRIHSFAILCTVLTACLGTPQTTRPRFDGDRALAHVRELVQIGPRVAGTPGAASARDYIRKQLAAIGVNVQDQAFNARTPRGVVHMINLRAVLPAAGKPAGTSQPRLVIGGHYDTKRFTEFTFVGANDGGSSAAFLIELARALKDQPRVLPIELLFLDGEEAVIEWEGNDHTYGSQHYVDDAQKRGALKDIRAFILVDMIGDRDLRIMREASSTAWLTDAIWAAARELNRGEFIERETPIEDDHVPFLRAGVPAVDIIDLEYPDATMRYWHTEQDTLDKLSAASLQAVGDVLIAALPAIESRAARP